jgi:hypothetical protein
MTYDHSATTIHRAALDEDIDAIRNERLLGRETPRHGAGERLRQAVGRTLIAFGTALIGRDGTTLRTHRA